MTRSLCLHIGSGKAGSTTIQRYVSELGDPAMGILPVRSFGISSATNLAAAAGGVTARKFFVQDQAYMTTDAFNENAFTLWMVAEHEVSQQPIDRFAASSEFLMNKVRGDLVENLHFRLKAIFEDVKIIVYLREPIGFIRSLWAQSVQGSSKSHLTFSEFVDTLENRRSQWDYKLLLTPWVAVFGQDAIEACVFDRRAFKGGDLLTDFAARIGAAMAPTQGDRNIKENVSPSDEDLDRMRFENHVAWARRTGADLPKHPARTEVDRATYEAQIFHLVSESNTWVNKTLLTNSAIKLPTG